MDISISKSGHNTWIFPVCGYSNLKSMPYNKEGFPTFTMCPVCKFEFGFDDASEASGEASGNVIESWNTYRRKFLEEISNDNTILEKVREWLNRIEVNWENGNDYN